MPNYQPAWVKGKEKGGYQRECADRYKAIKDFIPYKRRFSCFDLGANYGYFGLRLASDFDCVSVLVDTKPIRPLLKENDLDSVLWLNKRISTDELWKLARSESFDVVLALSVIHHFTDWQAAVHALLSLGEWVIFEVPGNEANAVNHQNHRQIREYVLSMDHIHLMDAPSHVNKGETRPIVAVRGENTITRQTIDADKRGAQPVSVQIFSNETDKGIVVKHKNRDESREFIPGMNLWNFKLLNGSWPENVGEGVKKAMIHKYHDDLRPWNFIIDGAVHPIDTNNKIWRTEMEKGGLDKCLKLLKMEPDYHDPEFTGLFRTA